MQMHVDQVERILALFLIGLWQVAASKKLLDRLSGFLDDIHECSPVQQVQELRQKNGTRDASRNEARAKLLGELIRAKGVRCLYLALGRHLGRICECRFRGKRT